jgi:hypothetical protein
VKRHGGLAVALLALISAVLAIPGMAEPPNERDQSGPAVPTLATYVVTSGAKGYLGFDTSIYPGDDAMRAWREGDRPYQWVGYYLPAVCHKDGSWSGKRETLTGMGWGIAVIYVGQQTWGRTSAPTGRAPSGKACSSNLVTASNGRGDADDAIQKTVAEGFAEGTVVFLDVERMDLVTPSMREYYRAWTTRLLEDGRYRPGIYAHKDNAKLIYDDVRGVFATQGERSEPPFWVASGRNFSVEKLPTDVGHHFAHVWQGQLDIVETRNGVKLPIDVNVAAVPSPSDGAYALQD